MTLSADEVVTRYTVDIWNKGNVELIRELCADPVTRHDVGKTTQLSHDEQIARVAHVLQKSSLNFENIIQTSDGTYVTAAFQVTSEPRQEFGPDGEPRKPFAGCGIEIFKVVDGRITDVWNHPMMNGVWG